MRPATLALVATLTVLAVLVAAPQPALASARTTFRILANHMQNVGMLAGLNVGWPDTFKDLFGWTRIFTIDLSALLVKLRLPTITQRLIFIAVSIALPLSLMVLTALVFFSISSIVQIAMIVCGLALLILHTMAFADPTILIPKYNERVVKETALWAGFCAVLTVLLYRIVRQRNYDVASSILWIGTMLFGLTLMDAGSVARRIIMSIFAVLFFFFWYLRADAKRRGVVGIFVILLMAGVIYASDLWSVYLPVQLRYVGWVLVSLGGCAILARVASLISSKSAMQQQQQEQQQQQQEGKNKDKEDESWMRWFVKLRAKFQRLLDTGLLTVILLLMSVVYAPVITNALQLFVCETYSCPPGYAFNPYIERPENDPFTVAPSVFCEACNFTADCNFATYDLCPGFSSRRLLYDPATTCDDSSYTSFIAAAILVLIVFVIILQVMYIKVIDICTRVMCVRCKSSHQRTVMQFQEDLINAPMTKEIDAPPSYDEKWEDVCLRVAPKASSLFDAFRFTLRYFILVESVYKTIEVLATTFLSPISPAAALVALAAHFVFLVVLALMRPFTDPTEQWLSVLLSFCMVLDGVYAVFMWQYPNFFGKDGWALGMLLFNVLIPLIGGSYLLYVNLRNQFCRKTLADKEKEEKEQADKEALQKRKLQEKKMSKRERVLARREARRKAMEEKLLKLEEMYSDAAVNNDEPTEFDEDGRPIAKKKTTKELKREQMTPSEKLAESLNVFTKKIILLYFAFLGVPTLCAALVLTLISGSISGNTEFVDASNLFDRTRATTLNNYYTWDEFSTSCCCFETKKFYTRGANTTERWVCMNWGNATARTNGTGGASFFRTRLDNAGNDGLAIRPLCGLHVVPECITQVQGDDTVKMVCEPQFKVDQNITSFAEDILW